MNCAVSSRRFLARLTPSNVSEAKLVRDSAKIPRGFPLTWKALIQPLRGVLKFHSRRYVFG